MVALLTAITWGVQVKRSICVPGLNVVQYIPATRCIIGMAAHIYRGKIENIDPSDRNILTALQRDCTRSLDELAGIAALSRNAGWCRIKALAERGIITARVALLDPGRLGLGLSVFMLIRAGAHRPDWTARFARATRDMPEILAAYRMTGDLDYLIHAHVTDVADYDGLYHRLPAPVEIDDISARFVMEEIKEPPHCRSRGRPDTTGGGPDAAQRKSPLDSALLERAQRCDEGPVQP